MFCLVKLSSKPYNQDKIARTESSQNEKMSKPDSARLANPAEGIDHVPWIRPKHPLSNGWKRKFSHTDTVHSHSHVHKWGAVQLGWGMHAHDQKTANIQSGSHRVTATSKVTLPQLPCSWRSHAFHPNADWKCSRTNGTVCHWLDVTNAPIRFQIICTAPTCRFKSTLKHNSYPPCYPCNVRQEFLET